VAIFALLALAGYLVDHTDFMREGFIRVGSFLKRITHTQGSLIEAHQEVKDITTYVPEFTLGVTVVAANQVIESMAPALNELARGVEQLFANQEDLAFKNQIIQQSLITLSHTVNYLLNKE